MRLFQDYHSTKAISHQLTGEQVRSVKLKKTACCVWLIPASMQRVCGSICLIFLCFW